jgi:esterase/lipase superfamily enzyme
LERASILKSALGNDVEVILWSWPSKRDGYFGNYDYDKESVGGVARQLFVRLLRSAKLASEQKAVHILAHSMGGWHTVGVLQVLSDDPNRPTLRNVILAAPDIPTNELEFALADMQRLTKRVTLYACESDWALTISRGMNDYPRGGMGGPRNILTNNMLDSIDVEARLFSTNHSYVFEAGKVLSDVASIVSGNDINLRGLIKTPKDGHYFWRFP